MKPEGQLCSGVYNAVFFLFVCFFFFFFFFPPERTAGGGGVRRGVRVIMYRTPGIQKGPVDSHTRRL